MKIRINLTDIALILGAIVLSLFAFGYVHTGGGSNVGVGVQPGPVVVSCASPGQHKFSMRVGNTGNGTETLKGTSNSRYVRFNGPVTLGANQTGILSGVLNLPGDFTGAFKTLIGAGSAGSGGPVNFGSAALTWLKAKSC